MNTDEYFEGYAAFERGLSFNSCRYDSDTDEAMNWKLGWSDASEDSDEQEEYGDEPFFEQIRSNKPEDEF